MLNEYSTKGEWPRLTLWSTCNRNTNANLEDLVDYHQKENKPVNASDIQDLSAARVKITSTLKYYSNINWLKAEKPGYYIPCIDLMMYFSEKESDDYRFWKNSYCVKIYG